MENTQKDKIQELIDIQKEIHNQNVEVWSYGMYFKIFVVLSFISFTICQIKNITDEFFTIFLIAGIALFILSLVMIINQFQNYKQLK